MLLDYYAYTLDEVVLAKFLPLLSGTLDFFSKHYGDVTEKGARLTIFPTQGGPLVGVAPGFDKEMQLKRSH